MDRDSAQGGDAMNHRASSEWRGSMGSRGKPAVVVAFPQYPPRMAHGKSLRCSGKPPVPLRRMPPCQAISASSVSTVPPRSALSAMTSVFVAVAGARIGTVGRGTTRRASSST
jgi:hypothetical protein